MISPTTTRDRIERELHEAKQRAAFLDPAPVEQKIRALQDQLATLDEADISAERAALVCDLRAEFERECERVQATADDLVAPLLDVEKIQRAAAEGAALKRFARELGAATGETFKPPDPVGALIFVVRDLMDFVRFRLSAPGRKPTVVLPPKTRAALDRLRALSLRP